MTTESATTEEWLKTVLISILSSSVAASPYKGLINYLLSDYVYREFPKPEKKAEELWASLRAILILLN